MFSKETQALAKATVEAIKKISKGKWEWKPQFGDYVLWNNELWFFRCYAGLGQALLHQVSESQVANIKACIPLLHWERIEEILEGMRYEVKEQRQSMSQSAQCWICPSHNHLEATGRDLNNYLQWRQHHTLTVFGKTRQEAVMRAVIELGKCLEG